MPGPHTARSSSSIPAVFLLSGMAPLPARLSDVMLAIVLEGLGPWQSDTPEIAQNNLRARRTCTGTGRSPCEMEWRLRQADSGAADGSGSRGPMSRRNGGYSSRISEAYAHTRTAHRLMPITKSYRPFG